MDLLYQRYASPFSFIDGMILSGRFDEFVASLWNTANKEKDEETRWQYFLHKVFEGSFEDFNNTLKDNSEHQNMSERTIETTMKHSMSILQNFNPERAVNENGLIQTSGNDSR